MKKVIRELIEKIKGLWNIYGGFTISTLIAWLTNFNKEKMDSWSSYLILSLTCVSVLTFFKLVLMKKKKNILDKGAMMNKTAKNLKTVVDPLTSGEEIGTAIIYTINGGKKFMVKFKKFLKAIWGNKFTLSNTIIVLFLATLSQVATYTDYLYKIEWFAQNEIVVKIASPIIAFIFTIIDLYTTYTKYGFESLDELAERKAQSLTKEQKQIFKNKLKHLKESLKVMNGKHEQLIESISNFEILKEAGYAVTSKETEEYESNYRQAENLKVAIENLNKQIEDLEAKL